MEWWLVAECRQWGSTGGNNRLQATSFAALGMFGVEVSNFIGEQHPVSHVSCMIISKGWSGPGGGLTQPFWLAPPPHPHGAQFTPPPPTRKVRLRLTPGPEVTRTQNQAKKKGSALRGFRKCIVCHVSGGKKIDRFQCSKGFRRQSSYELIDGPVKRALRPPIFGGSINPPTPPWS